MRLTEPEWIVMNVLWDKHPAKTRDVVKRLPSSVNWAYTTVKTILDRLVEKRVVDKNKSGNVGLYEPLISRLQARRTAFKLMLNQAFDGAFGSMIHFLVEDESLSESECKELITILSRKDDNQGELK